MNSFTLEEIIDTLVVCQISEEKCDEIIKLLPNNRTNKENASIHLYFKLVSEELNEIGHTHKYFGLKGDVLECKWNEILFKENIWRNLQKAVTGKETTTWLKNSDIKLIYEVLTKWLNEKGIYIPFPSDECPYFYEYMQNREIKLKRK